jgi:hypothetical protein
MNFDDVEIPLAAYSEALEELDRHDNVVHIRKEPPKFRTVTNEEIKKSDPLGMSNGRAKAKIDAGKPPGLPKDMRSFALTKDDLDQMEQAALDNVWVMFGIASLGDITAIYAKPNGGKTLLTLWMLVDAVKYGAISGKDILYINADDNGKGLREKAAIALEHGILMASPGVHGFVSKNLCYYLDEQVKADTAKGMVVVLDTMKKFTDTMDKKVSSAFMVSLRKFSVAGGTVIMLGHANKHRDADGKLVPGGTSDIPDDCDAYYFLDDSGDNSMGVRNVLFERIKSRGDNYQTMACSHAAHGNYSGYDELFDSVKRLNRDDTEKANGEVLLRERMEKNSECIASIIEAITEGINSHVEIQKYVYENAGLSRREVIKVLNSHAGKDWHSGKRWTINRQSKGLKIYNLIPCPRECMSEEYADFKDGFY